jgi:hypothetical protein
VALHSGPQRRQSENKKRVPDFFAISTLRSKCARNLTQNPLLKGNTVSNPHQGAATSLATKAIYMLFATILLVFVAMLALTVLHP